MINNKKLKFKLIKLDGGNFTDLSCNRYYDDYYRYKIDKDWIINQNFDDPIYKNYKKNKIYKSCNKKLGYYVSLYKNPRYDYTLGRDIDTFIYNSKDCDDYYNDYDKSKEKLYNNHYMFYDSILFNISSKYKTNHYYFEKLLDILNNDFFNDESVIIFFNLLMFIFENDNDLFGRIIFMEDCVVRSDNNHDIYYRNILLIKKIFINLIDDNDIKYEFINYFKDFHIILYDHLKTKNDKFDKFDKLLDIINKYDKKDFITNIFLLNISYYLINRLDLDYNNINYIKELENIIINNNKYKLLNISKIIKQTYRIEINDQIKETNDKLTSNINNRYKFILYHIVKLYNRVLNYYSENYIDRNVLYDIFLNIKNYQYHLNNSNTMINFIEKINELAIIIIIFNYNNLILYNIKNNIVTKLKDYHDINIYKKKLKII